jgi:hypothetical protein
MTSPRNAAPGESPSIYVHPPLAAAGPLGLCYQCVVARKTDPARVVAEAITLAPTAVPIGDQLGQVIGMQIVALPHCLACLSGTGSRLITT